MQAAIVREQKGTALNDQLTDSISELEEPFRLLVEHSNDILTIREADGRVRYTNPAFYRILGYEKEQIVGSTCFELLHPDDRDNVLTALDALLKKPRGRDSVQCRARHADGFWMTFEIVASNLLDHPEVRGLVVNGRRIDERAQRDASKEQLIEELKKALMGMNTLAGILSICASCKKIQTESGAWRQIEIYVRDRAPVEFSHGMCPECVQFWLPEDSKKEEQ